MSGATAARSLRAVVVPGWLAYQVANQPVLPTMVVTGLATGISLAALLGILALA